MSTPVALPLRFYPELLVDERVSSTGTARIDVELEEPVRGTLLAIVEGCVETRIRIRYLSGRMWMPVDYYKPATIYARCYNFTVAGDAVKRIIVNVNGEGEARLRVWRAAVAYRIDNVPVGDYALKTSAEALQEREIIVELPSDPAEQYKIVYEYEPGVLLGIEGAYPWTTSTIEVTALDEDVTLYIPGYQPRDYKITPCSDKWSSAIEATGFTTTLRQGRKMRVILNDYSFYWLAWFSGGGRLRIVERRVRPTAQLIQLVG